jgi:hypothetical protein
MGIGRYHSITKVIEKVECTVNPRTSSVNSKSPTDRSYLEVIDIDDDYLNPYQPIETNNQSGQYRLEDSSLSLDLSSFSVSDISLSNELEDSEILGIQFDWICLRIISPTNSLSHSILDSGCLVAKLKVQLIPELLQLTVNRRQIDHI